MTGFAGDIQVPAFQFEISFAMIEILYPAHYRKRLIVMTFGTVLPKLIVMNILMAIGAIGSFNTFELLKIYSVSNRSFVAPGTRHLFMFTGKFKFSTVVIEFRCRFKFFIGMAVSTIGRKRFLVIIGMTG